MNSLLDPRRFRKNTMFFVKRRVAEQEEKEVTPKKSLLDPRRFRKKTMYLVKRW